MFIYFFHLSHMVIISVIADLYKGIDQSLVYHYTEIEFKELVGKEADGFNLKTH